MINTHNIFTPVNPDNRSIVLCEAYGNDWNQALVVMGLVSEMLSILFPKFEEGDWDVYQLPQEGVFLVPLASSEVFTLSVGLRFDGEHLSAEMAGLLASLLANQVLVQNCPQHCYSASVQLSALKGLANGFGIWPLVSEILS